MDITFIRRGHLNSRDSRANIFSSSCCAQSANQAVVFMDSFLLASALYGFEEAGMTSLSGDFELAETLHL